MKMPPARQLIAVAGSALAGALVVAAPSAARADVGQYFEDRLHDFMDIFRLRAGVPNHGDAYGLKARATGLAQVGYVHFDGDYAGMDGRSLGWIEERRTEGGVSIAYASSHQTIPRGGNGFLMDDSAWSWVEDRPAARNLPYWDDGRGDFLGIGTEIATPLFSLDLAVKPSEAFDFLGGWFLADPYNDDELGLEEYWRYQYTEPTTDRGPDLEASTARKKAELDAVRARIEERKLQEEGQLGEGDLEEESFEAEPGAMERLEGAQGAAEDDDGWSQPPSPDIKAGEPLSPEATRAILLYGREVQGPVQVPAAEPTPEAKEGSQG